MNVHYFPIRHHGPGSAASLVRALDQLKPALVLIEGPADASDLLPALADPGMVPPVALLCYPPGRPAAARFWPFAEFSPEYQAALWAAQHKAEARFIDLPSAVRPPDDEGPDEVNPDEGTEAGGTEAEGGEGDLVGGIGQGGPEAGGPNRPGGTDQGEKTLADDPIGQLAAAAGHDDPESWWCDLVEQNPEPGPVFGAVSEAMTELRTGQEIEPWEAKREAQMRRQIAQAGRDATGPIAVVCGAWHVPGLQASVTASADRQLLAGLARTKTTATWAPWSHARLAFISGYGAGVAAPGWNLHLWRTWGQTNSSTVWLTRIARLLRDRGHEVSTASLIEAERLASSLAALRGRPRAGFEELRDAAVACLFNGEDLLWRTIQDELLLGPEIGQVPEGSAAAPLIEDVQMAQRAARLKPEALERELAVDLRTDSGRRRSQLLHRLGVLGIAWGELTSQGGSRGTFRENWLLCWRPEFSVTLVERVVYGSDLIGAAGAYLAEQMHQTESLSDLAALVGLAVAAELPQGWATGLRLLEEKAALTSDASLLLGAVAPLAETVRYGQARQVDSEPLRQLAERILVEAALGLRHAARGLDDSAAQELVRRLRSAGRGLELLQGSPPAGPDDEAQTDAAAGPDRLEVSQSEAGADGEAQTDEAAGPDRLEVSQSEAGPDDTQSVWLRALRQLLGDDQAAALAAGCAGHLLYAAGQLAPDDAVALIERHLSPGTPVAWAARFMEGFFTGGAARLIYDQALRQAVDQWVRQLANDDFLTNLPLLRRVFSDLDTTERKRLIDAVFRQSGARDLPGLVAAPPGAWDEHLRVLLPLLLGRGDD
ncbi:MAG: DUF5682 family protein [Bifidobacteriaceae bacterium]|jgi:hypothetical protein|nr:DUF5682 family protein [Bifidobacteriaceae bacterium]